MKTRMLVCLGSLTLAALGCRATLRADVPAPAYYPVAPGAAGFAVVAPEAYAPPVASPPQQGVASIYLPGAVHRSEVRYQILDGMAVYQGDMLLGPAHLVQTLYAFPRFVGAAPGAKYAAASSRSGHRWPNATIPYEIDGSVTPKQRELVDWAVNHMSTESVLKMRPRQASDRDYVVFTASGRGCSSYVGRIGGPQTIQVSGCGVRGSVVHEICHAAGFFHEQARKDRDNYIDIVWSEISAGEEAQFTISKETLDVGPYDYGSIMHYSRAAFSRSGRDTIIPKDPNARIGQREGLSPNDKAALAELYGGVTPTSPSQPLPLPIPTTPTTPTQPPAVASGFAGSYTSNRGDVTCGENGVLVNCSFPGGSLTCASEGDRLDCSWFGGGTGRAAFLKQGSGNLAGTYGDFLSSDNRGAWDLVRVSGAGTATTAPTTPTTPAGVPTIPGFPAIPGLPPLPAGAPIPPGVTPPATLPLPPLPPGWPFPVPTPPPAPR